VTLEQLKILVAVAEDGGLGAAAKALHRTQPTLSVGLKNLEEELGLQLFDRSGYRMKLTTEGEQILATAKRTLASVAELESQAAGYSQGRESEISIGLDYLCPLPILLSILRQFSETCQGTRIDLKFGVLAETENWLSQGEIDLALTPFLNERTDYEMSLLCELKVVPVLAAAKGEHCAESEFLQIPQIVVKTAKTEAERAPFSGRQEGVKWWVSDHMVKKQLILSGFGWGHLEYSSVADELSSQQVVELKNKYVRKTELPLYLARKERGRTGVVSNELWAYMKDEFEYV
jgi:DNA-binding transcriptional LysR family regulator